MGWGEPFTQEAITALRSLAGPYPRTSSYEGLSDGCFFCGDDRTRRCTVCRDYTREYGMVTLHQPGCPWVAARTLLEEPLSICENGHDDEGGEERPLLGPPTPPNPLTRATRNET
jgi:hypothetical protein